MAVTIDQTNVVAVLLPDGWHPILPGSFKIEQIRFNPTPPTVTGASKPDDDYGFSFLDTTRTNETREPEPIIGRLSAVLAVRQTTGPQPTLLPALEGDA